MLYKGYVYIILSLGRKEDRFPVFRQYLGACFICLFVCIFFPMSLHYLWRTVCLFDGFIYILMSSQMAFVRGRVVLYSIVFCCLSCVAICLSYFWHTIFRRVCCFFSVGLRSVDASSSHISRLFIYLINFICFSLASRETCIQDSWGDHPVSGSRSFSSLSSVHGYWICFNSVSCSLIYAPAEEKIVRATGAPKWWARKSS